MANEQNRSSPRLARSISYQKASIGSLPLFLSMKMSQHEKVGDTGVTGSLPAMDLHLGKMNASPSTQEPFSQRRPLPLCKEVVILRMVLTIERNNDYKCQILYSTVWRSAGQFCRLLFVFCHLA